MPLSACRVGFLMNREYAVTCFSFPSFQLPLWVLQFCHCFRPGRQLGALISGYHISARLQRLTKTCWGVCVAQGERERERGWWRGKSGEKRMWTLEGCTRLLEFIAHSWRWQCTALLLSLSASPSLSLSRSPACRPGTCNRNRVHAKRCAGISGPISWCRHNAPPLTISTPYPSTIACCMPDVAGQLFRLALRAIWPKLSFYC